MINHLARSLKRKFIITMRPFSSTKTSDYIKSTEKYFNFDIYVLHLGKNYIKLSDTPEQIAEHIVNIFSSLKTDSNAVIVSNIVLRGDKNKEKAEKAIQIINNAYVQRNIPVIKHTKANSKRHLNISKLDMNGYGKSIFIRN